MKLINGVKLDFKAAILSLYKSFIYNKSKGCLRKTYLECDVFPEFNLYKIKAMHAWPPTLQMDIKRRHSTALRLTQTSSLYNFLSRTLIHLRQEFAIVKTFE